jgi:hypothetical protein
MVEPLAAVHHAMSDSLDVADTRDGHARFLAHEPADGSVDVSLAPISVQQFDQYGNGWSIPPGPPYSVTLALGVNPAGATLHGTTTRTVFGSTPAIFDDIVIDRPGNGYTLIATSGTMSVTSAPFAVQ